MDKTGGLLICNAVLPHDYALTPVPAEHFVFGKFRERLLHQVRLGCPRCGPIVPVNVPLLRTTPIAAYGSISTGTCDTVERTPPFNTRLSVSQ